METNNGKRVWILAIGASLGWLMSTGSDAQAGAISGQVINQSTGLGMGGITVSLYDPGGDLIGTPTTTNATGNYSFTGVASGNYLIQENAPTGLYQSNSTFPNYTPVGQSTPGAYGTTPGNWDYTGTPAGVIGPNTPPQGWVTSGTPAPFESALNLTGPTVNLGNFVTENLTNTNQYTETLKNSAAGDPGYQVQATSFAAGLNESISLNGSQFSLSNIHYHDPSENIVNGVAQGTTGSYAMEEHFVFQSPMVNGVGGGEVVLAAFVQLGTAANLTFDKLFGALVPPNGLSTTGGSTLPGSTVGTINFADLLPSNMQGWFYPGSLTTPPLSTPVSWFVFSTPIEIDQQELTEYQNYATAAGFYPNARPTQQLNGRTLNDLTSITLGTTDLTGVNIINAAVPEPSSWVMMGTAGIGLLGLCRFNRHRSAA